MSTLTDPKLSDLINKYKYGDCSQLHEWEPSCTKNSLTLAFDTFTLALKLYGPLFIIPAVLFQRKSLKYIVQKTVPDVIQSSIFLGLFPSSYSAACCSLRHIRGSQNPSSLFFSGFIAGLVSIPFEQKRRRSELALYVANQASEAIYKSLANKGYLPRIPYGETLLFCITTALLFYFYEHEPKNLRSNVRSLLGFLVGPSSTDIGSSHNSDHTKDDQEDNNKEDNQEDNDITNGDLKKVKTSSTNGTAKGHGVDEKPTIKELIKVLKASGRAFLIGYGIRGILQLLSTLATKRKLLKTPRKFINTVFGSHSLNFGIFVLWIVGGYKGGKLLLRQIREKDDKYNTLIAGAFSGLGIIFSASTEMVMYVASKAAEGLFKAGVSRGYYKSWYYGDIAIFAVSCAFLFYYTFFEPEVLRPSYDRFLVKYSKGKVAGPRKILREILINKARVEAELKLGKI